MEQSKSNLIVDLVGESWAGVIGDEFSKEYMAKVSAKVKWERGRTQVCPEPEDVFRAYKLTPFDKVKVVIIGQDPYYNGAADGLAFSFKDGRKIGGLQSLDVIFMELERDVMFGLYLDMNYDLSWLAEQGVFLLNTILTVERNKPLSHQSFGWQRFTGMTIANIIKHKENVVFMLWGSEAKNFYTKVVNELFLDDSKHLILTAVHPAYDLRNYNINMPDYKPNYPNTFYGCSHFSKANKYLEENGIKRIKW